MKQDLTNADDRAAALLRVASYLGRPQKFMAVAEARAEMRRTLEMVAKGSVVLTTHGEPERLSYLSPLSKTCDVLSCICSLRGWAQASRVLRRAFDLSDRTFRHPHPAKKN